MSVKCQMPVFICGGVSFYIVYGCECRPRPLDVFVHGLTRDLLRMFVAFVATASSLPVKETWGLSGQCQRLIIR